MATFLTSAAHIPASPAPGFGGFSQPQITPEQARMQAIADAFSQNLWVVSFPWGANAQNMIKDGSRETKHLLMTQKGPIGYSSTGNVFGVIRAEGFLIWKPSLDADNNVNIMTGSWQLPTACRQGPDKKDVLIPGAKTQGMHSLILGGWKTAMKKLAAELEAVGETAKAKEVLEKAASFSIADAFSKEINFNLPIGIAQLQEMKAQAAAAAAAEGVNRKSSKQVFNCVLAVTFGLDADGEFKMRVHHIIDAYAPVMTIPCGEFNPFEMNEIMSAIMAGEVENESKEEKVERLTARAEAIASNSGKAAKNRKQGKEIEILAKQVGCDYGTLKTALQTLGGHLGTPEGLRKHGKDVAFLKAYILSNGNGTSPAASITAGATVEAETTEEPQTTNMFAGATTDAEEVEASDIDII